MNPFRHTADQGAWEGGEGTPGQPGDPAPTDPLDGPLGHGPDARARDARARDARTREIDAHLRAREAELQRRERALRDREAELEAGGVSIRRKNWPRCRPVTYVSVRDDIPVPHQGMVRAAYVNWVLCASCFLLTALTLLVLWPMQGVGVDASGFFLSCLAALVGAWAAWKGWFRGVYRAAQTDRAFVAYTRAHLLLSAHVLWCAWAVVAPPVAGRMCAGVFTLVDAADAPVAAVVFVVLNIAAWATHLLLTGYVLAASVRAYRGDAAAAPAPNALFRAGEKVFGRAFEGGAGGAAAAGGPGGAPAVAGPAGAFGP